MKKVCVALLLQGAALSALELGLEGGVRQDYLRWTIGMFETAPNILSEVTWKNVRSFGVGVAAHQLVYKNVGINGSISAGKIFSGEVWDRDWMGDGKTGLFSISQSSAHKGFVLDGEVEARSYWPLWGGILSESVGLGYHRLHLTMVDGWHIEYAASATPRQMYGLDNTYTAQFFGPYLGLNYTLPFHGLYFNCSYSYTFAKYRAKGYWNLRTDFADDFIHSSNKGFGHTFSADLQYPLSNCWSFGLLFVGRYFKCYGGTDLFYFYEDGEKLAGAQKLVNARWVNAGLFLYATYQFEQAPRRRSTRERLNRYFSNG